jgi:hypothetical protein
MISDFVMQEAPGRLLHAGNIELLYEHGSVRYLSLGNEEIIRRIYVALRDINWGTYTPYLSKEKIIQGTDCFTISYDCHYKVNNLPIFKWQITIEGSACNEVTLTISGEALRSFKMNRGGLCVLHPVRPCAGRSCAITDPSGYISKHVFPEIISAHQPFKNISKMQWETSYGTSCDLAFEGDIFETEDQRNWTDASYKTYSTPLDDPIPIILEKGGKIRQSVTFRITKSPISRNPQYLKMSTDCIGFNRVASVSLPVIGSVLAFPEPDLDRTFAACLTNLRLSYVRVDLNWSDKSCSFNLRRSLDQVLNIKTRLEIALQLTTDFATELDNFISFAKNSSFLIRKIILLGPSKVVNNTIIKQYGAILKHNFPETRIGGGTDCNYAELNRDRFNACELDFISFSINPQVHAFDNLTLVENMEAQYDAVLSARQLYPNLPINISPVTLRPRFNPDASQKSCTSSFPEKAVADPRQWSLFAAGWTLGSLRNLAAAGASEITYYKTSGKDGLIVAADAVKYLTGLLEGNVLVSPIYTLLYLIQEFAGGRLFTGISRNPLKYSGILLERGNHKRWIVASHSSETLNITIDNLSGKANFRSLDGTNEQTCANNFSLFIDSKGIPIKRGHIEMRPYGIYIIDKIL